MYICIIKCICNCTVRLAWKFANIKCGVCRKSLVCCFAVHLPHPPSLLVRYQDRVRSDQFAGVVDQAACSDWLVHNKYIREQPFAYCRGDWKILDKISDPEFNWNKCSVTTWVESKCSDFYIFGAKMRIQVVHQVYASLHVWMKKTGSKMSGKN